MVRALHKGLDPSKRQTGFTFRQFIIVIGTDIGSKSSTCDTKCLNDYTVFRTVPISI